MPFKSFYWSKSEEAQRLWKEAKETAKREGKTMSQLIREFLEQYVQLHEPGNPQQRLDTIVRLGKKYVSPKVCGFKNCMRDAVALGIYKGQHYPLCENHLRLVSDALEWKIKKVD
jgi:hypothetical protein